MSKPRLCSLFCDDGEDREFHIDLLRDIKQGAVFSLGPQRPGLHAEDRMIIPGPLNLSLHTPAQTLWMSRELRHPLTPLGMVSCFLHSEWNERYIVKTILFPHSEDPDQKIEFNEFFWLYFGHDRRTVNSKYRLKINVPPFLDHLKSPIREKVNELVRQDLWSKSMVTEIFLRTVIVDHNTTLFRDRSLQLTPIQRLTEDIKELIQDITQTVYLTSVLS